MKIHWQSAGKVGSAVLAICTAAQPVWAWDWPNPARDAQERFTNSQSLKPVYLHRFLKGANSPAGALTTFDPQMSLDQVVTGYLRNNILNPLIQIKNVKSKGNALNLSGEGIQSNDYEFYVSGVPICGYQVRAHKLRGSSQPVVFGSVPNVNVYEVPSKKNWPRLDETYERVVEGLSDDGINVAHLKIAEKRRCLYVSEKELYPVWDLIVEANDLPFTTIASDQKLYSLSPRFFDVTGTAQAYEKNPDDGTLVQYTITDLTGTGYLENDRFVTSVSSGSKAYNADHNFIYSPSQTQFDEVSVFAHANEQGDFFGDIGYDWSESDQVTLVVHAIIDGSSNNALYTPASGKVPPKIQVGDGDGVRLDNLPKDSDVVSHELGHHVIFGSLQSVEGESLVIHEGLADYFAFAKSGDACLGESICPAGSPIGCEIAGKCLRSGDNDYVLGENTKSEAHLKSQFVSGMLWDLRGGDVPAGKLDKIVYRGVSMLLSSSGYHDMVLAFLHADDELYKGKYCKTIYKAAQKRGLSSYIDDFDCDNLPSEGFDEKNGGTSGGTSVSSSDSDSKKKFLFCGISSANADTQGSSVTAILSWLIFLLPLLILRRGREDAARKGFS